MSIVRPIAVVMLWLGSSSLAGAQTPATFPFISISRATAGDEVEVFDVNRGRQQLVFFPDGRLEVRALTLVDLARVAYEFEQLNPGGGVVTSSAGRWTTRDRFDVVALSDKPWTRPPPGERIPSELRPMLRAVLEDRFALAARIETRRVSAWALRRATPQTTSPMLRPSAGTCKGPYAEPASPPDLLPCPLTLDSDRIEAGAVTMTEFARLLRFMGWRLSDRPIVDETGLAGRYDIALRLPKPANYRLNAADQLRQAMKTQLGLDLQSAKLAVPSLRIVSASKPVED